MSDTPRVDPYISLPVEMDRLLRETLTQILRQHALQINKGAALGITSITSGQTVANDIVLVDSTATATIVATLPTASTWTDQIIRIKQTSTTGIVIAVAQSGDTIDGAASVTVSTGATLPCFQFVSDGSNWHIVSSR